MGRSKALVVGLAIGMLPVSLASGLGGLSVLFLAFVGIVGIVGYWLVATVRMRTAGAELTWTPPTGSFAFVAAAPHSASHASVAAALGRVESRRVLDSVAFWTGIGFGGMSVWLFGWEWGDDQGGDIGSFADLTPWLVHPLIGMILVSAHRARTRGRRDGVAELFASCPASEHERDVGHLATAWVGALAVFLIAAASLAAFALRAEVVWGPFGGRQVAQIVGCSFLAVGATALGVLLARSAPWSIAPVVVLVVIGLALVQIPKWGDSDGVGWDQLTTAPPIQGYESLPSRLTAMHWRAHQGWIVALVAVVVCLLLWVGNRRRAQAAALAFAVAAAAAAGWAATRPLSDADVDRIVSMITELERHQECTDFGVPVCTFHGDDALAEAFGPHLTAVLDAVPAGASIDDLVFRQGSDVRVSAFPDPIAARLAGWRPAPGVAPVELTTDGYDAARFWLALAATGVADETAPGTVVDLGGQARGVVVIWLASREVPEQRALTEMASLAPSTDHGQEWYGSRPWPDPCRAGTTPVSWAHSDLEATRQLIAAPEEEVTAVLHARWNEWLDPAIPTDALLEALGAPALAVSLGRTPVTQC